MSVMNLNIYMLLFKRIDLDMVTITIYAYISYIRSTMKTWYFDVISLHLKPLGECLISNHLFAFSIETVLRHICI